MECNYNREYFTKHGMHLNRKGKGLVSKQLASDIWKLSATEEIPPIIIIILSGVRLSPLGTAEYLQLVWDGKHYRNK
jgi:hypothetical protein